MARFFGERIRTDPPPSLEMQSTKREGSRKLAARSGSTIPYKPRLGHRSASRMRSARFCGRHPDSAALGFCSRSGKRGTDSLNLGRVWQSANAPVQVAYPTTQSAKMTVCHGNCQNFCASFSCRRRSTIRGQWTMNQPAACMNVTSIRRAFPFALILGALLAVGCHSIAHPRNLRSVSVTLKRTACYGTCPVYTVAIHGSGLVEYFGEWHVDVPGPQMGRIPPGRVKDLLKASENIHFFDLKDKYFENCTDLPTAIISIAVDGKTKQVSNYFGGCEGGKAGPLVDLARLA